MKRMGPDLLKAVFVLGILLQVIWLGLPIPAPDQRGGVEAMLQPITGVVMGFAVYAFRALGVALVVVLLLNLS